jgi:hypothetical protein
MNSRIGRMGNQNEGSTAHRENFKWTEKNSETVLYICAKPISITHTFMGKRTYLVNIIYVH